MYCIQNRRPYWDLFAFSTKLQQLESSRDLCCARIREADEKAAFKDAETDALLQRIPVLETRERELSNAVSADQNIPHIDATYPFFLRVHGYC